MSIMLVSVFICFVVFVVILYQRYSNTKIKSLNCKHVVITGGSSGIGKALAIEAAGLGAHVTIISRNVGNLERTVSEVLKHCRDRQTQRVQYVSLDVTDDYESISKALLSLEETVGPIYMLVNCAGMAICGRLEDMTVEEVKHMVNLNYYGTVFPTKAILGPMKTRGEGSIVFVASQAAFIGIYGYGAYGASKWGIRGLGESLLMELLGTGVTLTISFPPDTDTPGFEIEEASKPQETKLISESGTLVSPQLVAQQLLQDALKGKAYSSTGMDGWMLRTLCGTAWFGFSQLFQQCILIGPLRLVFACYQLHFQRIILKCKKAKNTNKKAE